ncbi:protein PHLOEM PROTEIN 2-LIKE A1-like [Rhododendron vialii]|uniref:protein PHLOEM PROTEIN 2-LIKE A1-like n=1 Tax=Rhododendron vialii TaxID=182163 RepID=UPI00265D878B|nr:protein PHLOEM PROTEIN 2-LIKE A1-like [Rhododendron vialii]
MALNQDEETRGKESKGKEIAAGNSRRITRPPLSFLAILYEHGIALDTSCPDQLCQQLYDGVFLKPNKMKYFVDEKSNKNCFVLFARELAVVHGDNPDYWRWMEDNETSGKDIEVAELLKICWLEIGGAIRTINLSPGTLYEIVFILMKRNNDSQFNLDLTIKPQHSKALKRSESLEDKPLNNWCEVLVGEFVLSAQYVGYMEFSLGQYDGDWKHGLVVKCAIIRPKK